MTAPKPVEQRRRAVPADELVAAFNDLPEIDRDAFRAGRERYVDPYAHHDVYERARDEGRGA